MGLLSKTTTLVVHRIVFGHFFFVPVGLRRENAWIHAFMRDENNRRRIFLFLNLSAVPKKSTLKKFAYINFSANWNKRDNVWKNANSF